MTRTARAIAGIALIGAGAAIATGWWWPSTAEAREDVREEISAVEIDSDSGDVRIRAANVETTTVNQRLRYTWSQPDRAFTVDDGTLVLEDCGWNCTVDYEVVVPLGTDVRGEANSGDITLDGVAGVDVNANSGDVSVRNVDAAIKVEANSGDIELRLEAPGEVTAEANSGDIRLTVPRADYRITGSSNSGDRTISVPTDPGSQHVLDLETNSGDVVVRAG